MHKNRFIAEKNKTPEKFDIPFVMLMFLMPNGFSRIPSIL